MKQIWQNTKNVKILTVWNADFCYLCHFLCYLMFLKNRKLRHHKFLSLNFKWNRYISFFIIFLPSDIDSCPQPQRKWLDPCQSILSEAYQSYIANATLQCLTLKHKLRITMRKALNMKDRNQISWKGEFGGNRHNVESKWNF